MASPNMSDPVITVLSRVGLQDDQDVFRALLIPFEDLEAPTRYGAAVALVGTLMTKAGFSRALVSIVVRDLIKGGPSILEGEGQAAVISYEGTKLFVPGVNSGKVYDIQTQKPTDAGVMAEPLTATVFSLKRAFGVCEGL